MRTVFVQQVEGRFKGAAQYGAWLAFRSFGYDVRTFEGVELDAVPRDPEVLVVGGIGAVHAALERVGRPRPPPLDLPDCLAEFRGRRVWRSTLGEVRRLARAPVFVKPLRRHKAFTGHVVASVRDLLGTAHLPDELEVLAQEPVEILSEWRAYVLRGEVLGCHHYNGAPLRFPEASAVEAMVRAFERAGAPAAYGVDAGTTPRGTLLVEVNDGFALGNYGLSDTSWARMVEARCDELVSTGTPAVASTMTLADAP